MDAAIAALTLRVEFELGKLRVDMTRGTNGLIEIQDAMKEHLEAISGQSAELKDKAEEIETQLSTQLISHMDLNDKVDKLLKHFHIGTTAGPSSSGPASDPPSPSFTFPSPPIPSSSPVSTSTPTTVILPSPTTLATVVLPSPVSPTTKILPSPSLDNPTTEPFHPDSPSSTPLVHLNFEDDKGEENSKD